MDVEIGTGNHYSLILRDGVIYSAGENTNSQLARGGGDEAELTSLEPIVLPDGFTGTITDISAGQLHGAFLTDEGSVYTWGDGNLGKLGHGGTANVDSLVPTKVMTLDGIEVASILMANGASFAVTTEGILYAWGQNTNGQLGIGNLLNQGSPVAISSASFGGETVADVSSGTSFTLVLTQSGEVYAMGGNVQQQVGPSALGRQVPTPVRVEVPGEVVTIEAGTNTAFAITAIGEVYGWGQSDFGQLVKGRIEPDGSLSGFNAASSSVPTLVPGLPADLAEIHVGSRWVIGITEGGEVWTWGDQGWLDAPREGVVMAPRVLSDFDGIRIVDVVSGPNHALLTDADGNVYGIGATADGRLGFLQADADRASGPVLMPVPDAGVQVVVDGADDQTTGSAITAGALGTGKTSFHLYGFGGEDTITGSEAGDALDGGEKSDLLLGGGGADTLKGAAGADTLTGAAGADVFAGTAAQLDGDTITDFQVGDTIRFTDAGISSLSRTGDQLDVSFAGGASASITLEGGLAGTLSFLGGSVSLTAAPPVASPVTPPLTPTAGPDALTGTSGPDAVSAGLGDDTVSAGFGNDTVNGNQGNDAVNGNQGNDLVQGGQGDDIAHGGQGNDDVFGNLGNDNVFGDLGLDTVSGGDGDDTVYGGQGPVPTGSDEADSVSGGLGRDFVSGNQGNDAVLGNQGDDTVHGGQGDDFVHGGQGNDIVSGDRGNDTVGGGLGEDTLAGGAGSDLFVFAAGNGRDVVTDFDFTVGDRLDFGGRAYSLDTAQDGSAEVVFADGGTIILLGVALTDFTASFVAP